MDRQTDRQTNRETVIDRARDGPTWRQIHRELSLTYR